MTVRRRTALALIAVAAMAAPAFPARATTIVVAPGGAPHVRVWSGASEQAGFFAERLTLEAGADPAAQTQRAFQLAFSRGAAPEEIDASRALIAEHGLTLFCRALFNANEFVYVF